MKNDALKYKTQLDEANDSIQTLNHNLEAANQRTERMKKMRDDDAVCYVDCLKQLKAVGEASTAVLSIFPADDSTSKITPDAAESSGFAGQVRSIPGKMMKYIRSSIHTGIVQAITIIKSWNPQQNLDCLLEGANPDSTDEQISEYQASQHL